MIKKVCFQVLIEQMRDAAELYQKSNSMLAYAEAIHISNTIEFLGPYIEGAEDLIAEATKIKFKIVP